MKTYIILLVVLTGLIPSVFGQEDSISVSQSPVDQTDEKYDRVYKLFIEERDRELSHLWKVDLVQLSLRAPNLGYEQRIGNSFSSCSYIRYNLNSTIQEPELAYYFRVNQSFRWYYNLKRRERLGKSFNGFSGNFIALDANYNRQKTISYFYFNEEITRVVFQQEFYSFSVSYGIQRRIGNIGYIGLMAEWVGIFATYAQANGDRSNINQFLLAPWPSVRLEAGFAIDSFRNIKRMLR